MKIENSGINPLTSKPTEGAHPVEKNNRAAEQSTSVGSRDRATLSERARTLAKARTALNDAPDVRSEKVQHIKEQIDSGKYQINFEELAGKLLGRLGLK